MKYFLKKVIFGIVLAGVMLPSFAKSPKVGSSLNGGVFIYRNYIEGGYWVDWVAFPRTVHKKLPTNKGIYLAFSAEGKDTFTGNVTINCKNGESNWENGSYNYQDLTSEASIKEIIPDPVIKNSIRQFCKNGKRHK